MELCDGDRGNSKGWSVNHAYEVLQEQPRFWAVLPFFLDSATLLNYKREIYD